MTGKLDLFGLSEVEMVQENEGEMAGSQRLVRAAWWTHAVVGVALNWIILAPIVREIAQLQP